MSKKWVVLFFVLILFISCFSFVNASILEDIDIKETFNDLLSYFDLDNSITGKITETQDNCIDSDGANYYLKGYGYDNIKYFENNPVYDECHPDKSNVLRELICREDGYIDNPEYVCPNGCEDGACIQVVNEEENITRHEICNNLDDDNDGEVDEDFDNDGDGYWDYTSCVGYSAYENRLDCNDNDNKAHVNAVEVCDGSDNDCNGETDKINGRILQKVFNNPDGKYYQTCQESVWQRGECLQKEDCSSDIDNDCDGLIPDVDPDCVVEESEPINVSKVIVIEPEVTNIPETIITKGELETTNMSETLVTETINIPEVVVTEEEPESINTPEVLVTGSIAHYWGNIDAEIGDLIIVKDQENIISGTFVILTQGEYGILNVYGDDPGTDIDEGPVEGEKVKFFLNNEFILESDLKVSKNTNLNLIQNE